MARQSSVTKEPKKTLNDTRSQWAALTWNDLDKWAGSRSVERGRRYQRDGVVKNLALAEDGRLLATVIGGEKYTVSVTRLANSVRGAKLQSTCTCPVGSDGCKHAVATIAEFLQLLADNKPVPAADADDPRWAKLSANDDDEADEEEDDWEGETDDDDVSNWPEVARRPSKQKDTPIPKSASRTKADWDDQVRSLIDAKSKKELASLVWTFVERFPELRAEFQERIALAEGDVKRLVADTKTEMRKVTAEIGWQNHWERGGHIPNYSRLKHRLERLVELGHADEVVALGPELIERGMAQVGQSQDEGETAIELSECLDVVFQAVAHSSLPSVDKILFAIEACLMDGYDVLGESFTALLDSDWQPADWSGVADRLIARLPKTSSQKIGGDFSQKYQRDRISGWLLTALENAGRDDELLAVYETEARTTCSYERLVRYLIQQERLEDAERWAREGIEQTREKYAGIASSLRKLLCDVAASQQQWDVVAAHAAAIFFERPSAPGFDELMAAAKKAKCGDGVRRAALRFLETGEGPIQFVTRKGEVETIVDPAWLLPVIDYLFPAPKTGKVAINSAKPHWGVLLGMAIAEKRPDDVLKWYDKMIAKDKPSARIGFGSGFYYSGGSYAEQVAAAVTKSHPHRALEIYQQALDGRLPHADPSAYEACAGYLKRMKPIYQSLGREEDWQAILTGIRQKYGNRPRFMETLDKLQERTILQTQKTSRSGATRR